MVWPADLRDTTTADLNHIRFVFGFRMRNNSPASHFVANLDAYGGNSGSPVFSGKSYELEGLAAADRAERGPLRARKTAGRKR